MKIKSIAQICKADKRILIFETKADCQWIGSGSAVYPLYNLPKFDTDSICSVLDINEKQKSKLTLKHTQWTEQYDYADVVDAEALVVQDSMAIVQDGRVLLPFYTSTGTVFIEEKYLSPLADIAGELVLYERFTPHGRLYFAAKVGFMIYGIILPYDVISKEFIDKLDMLTKFCKLSLLNKENNQITAEEEQILFGERDQT